MRKITPTEIDRRWVTLPECRSPGAIRLAARPFQFARADRADRTADADGQPDFVRAKRVVDTMSAMFKIDLARCGRPGPTRRTAQCRRRPRAQDLQRPQGRPSGMPAVPG